MPANYHYRTFKVFSICALALFVLVVPVTYAQTVHHDMAMSGTTTSAKAADIVRDPADVPPPVGNRAPSVVHVALTAQEVVGTLDAANGTTYRYWTFNGKVPGPMVRVRQGDMVEVTLHNDPSSHMAHSLDFHAAIGPGGGAALSQTMPGQTKTFTFQATTPGLFVYHCGTPMIGDHIANGMYGMILVEPAGGLPHVDHEYYMMQGEIYTAAPMGKPGLQQFSSAKLLQDNPEYYVFNGAVNALMGAHEMHANAGDTIRLFFGNAGPNATSSFHMVGQIFTREYELGSLISPPVLGVQTGTVPAGGAAMFELTMSSPGKFPMMDHAMGRMPKGLMAVMDVTGAENAELMHAGPAPDSGEPLAARLTGMTESDTKGATVSAGGGEMVNSQSRYADGGMNSMPGMAMNGAAAAATEGMVPAPPETQRAAAGLNGCLTLQADGKAMLKVLSSSKVFRLEGRALRFSENANRLVHVTGRTGSIMAVEDPNVPSYIVDTVDELAPGCSAHLTAADVRKALNKSTETPAGTVRMGDMGFFPPTITINAGEKVTWTNSSQVFHNVVDDASKALSPMDVSLPSGGRPFDSGMMQPGQNYSRVFTTPGVYHYVCTLHEGNGMKGAVIVKPASALLATK